MKRIETSWGGVSSWYDDLLEGAHAKGTYQEKVILPNLLRLLAPFKGMRMLDLACGQGYFSRAFNKVGMQVVGVDLSADLIDIAHEKSPKDIKYFVSSADSLDCITSSSIDVVTVVLALQNIDNVRGVFKESARVLKKGGSFFIVLNHPTFRIPKQSAWGFDEKGGIQYRRVDAYMSSSRSVISMHPGKDKSVHTVSFHQPIQYYAKQLFNAGFCITRFEEWISHRVSKGTRAAAENLARKEFPLFLLIEARCFD